MRCFKIMIRVLPAVLLAAAFVLHTEALSAEDEGEAGIEVTEVSGEPAMLLEGKEEWQPLQEDTFLLPGDKVRTETDSSAEFVFDEDGENAIRLEALTEVEVILEEDEKISLINGEVFSIIDNLPEGSAFEIRTPTAVCGARGTDWVTKFDGSETQVESVTGDTYVTGYNSDGSRKKERTIVPPGTKTAVRWSMAPKKPVRFKEERLSELNALKGNVSRRARGVISKRKALPGALRRSDRLKKKRFMPRAEIGPGGVMGGPGRPAGKAPGARRPEGRPGGKPASFHRGGPGGKGPAKSQGRPGPGGKTSKTPNKLKYGPVKKRMPDKLGRSQKSTPARVKSKKKSFNKKPSVKSMGSNAKGTRRAPAKSSRSSRKPAVGRKKKR